MKIGQVVFLLTLGVSANAVAQTPPGDTLLIASETMPEGAAFFPELLASSHVSLVGTLTPATNVGTLAAPANTAAAPTPRLTGKDRLILFWNDSYASPGSFAGLFAGALVDQVRHTPAKWDEDGSGYTRRFASEYGQLAARNVIHEGLAGITGLDPRYQACECYGIVNRSAHAVKMTFTTYRQDGRLTLDVPQIAGAYGSGMISTYWYPHRLYSPLVQGVQFGHEQMGENAISNVVQEFGPDLKRALHLRSITARSHPSSYDDD